MTDDAMAWLLDGDVAVRFQATRDLLREPAGHLQDRIAHEGHGATLLAARGTDGHWGRGFYQPKWTSSHYTLLELKNLGISPDTPAAQETVALIVASNVARDGGLDASPATRHSDACIAGMGLGYACYFGADAVQVAVVADFLLGQRLRDGAFNCRLNRSGATHSSVHTTVSVIEGITEYLRRGYPHRAEELADARATSVEFLLRHRLYRSERTGAPISPELTRLHHPPRWHYDILRGLDALADAGVPHDERMTDALDVLRARRRPDGRWVAHRGYPGLTHDPPEPAGQPSRWVTLVALRVLAAYGDA